MVNPNAPFGLRPVRHMKGGVIRANEYNIADQYATALFLGDPVVATGTGINIGIATAGSSSVISGVFAGCEYLNALGDTIFSKSWPASQVTDLRQPIKAFVYDDPDLLFEIQFATLAAADIRQLANLVSGVGNAQTGLSAWTAAAPITTENQLKIFRLSNEVRPGGVPNAYGAFAVAQVLIAFHELAGNMQEL